MGMLDNLKDKAEAMANDPENRAKFEDAAKDFATKHNISVDEAKKRMTGGDK